MKMVKSLFLGSAAGLVAVAGAQAADLPVKAKPVQYVKICSLYGAGFYYIPGTDTCIKLGGFVRIEENFNSNGSYAQYHSGTAQNGSAFNFDNPNASRYYERTRGLISVDARSQTEYGTLRAYLDMSMQDNNSNGPGAQPYFGINTSSTPSAAWANNAFIQIAGFTAGKTTSFFDFDLQPYSNQTNIWGSNQSGNGVPLFAYTAQFGNGLSASISAEDTVARQTSVFEISGGGAVPAWTGLLSGPNGYAAKGWPDIVANLRVDQAWGSAQAMVAAHDVNPAASSTNFTYTNKVGWAAGAGLKLNAPMMGMGDYFIIQGEYAVGAMNYVMSGTTGVGQLFYNLQQGFPAVTNVAQGVVVDAVTLGDGSTHLTSGWSVTGGYEHRWNTNFKSSLYGAYGKIQYDPLATLGLTVFLNGGTGAPGQEDWSQWQVGTRTVWTPVENLDLSVEVMYNDLSSANKATAGFSDMSWWSGMFRVQRNFWP